MPLLVLFAQRHTRNVLSVIVCYNTSFSSFFVQGRREENLVHTVFACSVLRGGWNFYFIILTFVSHLTSPKTLTTLICTPVLMMTKKCWTAKMFTEIIHVFPNATTPEQHNLKFTNTLQCVICHLDFRTSWMCFTESIALICLSYSKLIFFAVLKTSILNHYI